jgi:hypothetical protein
LWILGCVAFAIGISGYIVLGATARYMQDDYCYSVILSSRGFWQEQVASYLHETTYAGNRFSLTFGMALSEVAGRWTIPVLPGLAILLFIVGLYGVMRRLHYIGGPVLNKIRALLAAEAIALFTISMAPNWVQIIYWRNGMMTYFAPLIGGIYLTLLLLPAGKRKKGQGFLLAGIFILAWFTAGFAETGAATEGTALILALGLASLSGKQYRPWLLPLGIALAGCCLAIALLLLSPGNAPRLAASYSAPAGLLATLSGTLYNTGYFYVYTAYRQTLPYILLIIFFGLLPLLNEFPYQERSPLATKHLALRLVLWCGATFVATAAAVAPSQYAESSYPAPRALLIPRFISVMAGAAIGNWTGRLLSKWANASWKIRLTVMTLSLAVVLLLGFWLAASQGHLTPPAFPDVRAYLSIHWQVLIGVALLGLILGALLAWRNKVQFALAILFGLCLLEPLLVANRVYAAWPSFQDRAAMWDAREEQILLARAAGEQEITVRALDSLAEIAELSADPDYWVNNCAERYYGIESLRAVEPVLNHFSTTVP